MLQLRFEGQARVSLCPSSKAKKGWDGDGEEGVRVQAQKTGLEAMESGMHVGDYKR